jgi:hypothetical protein
VAHDVEPLGVVADADHRPSEVGQAVLAVLVTQGPGRVVMVRAVDEDGDRTGREVVDEVGPGAGLGDGDLCPVGQPQSPLVEPVDELPLQAGVGEGSEDAALVGTGRPPAPVAVVAAARRSSTSRTASRSTRAWSPWLPYESRQS